MTFPDDDFVPSSFRRGPMPPSSGGESGASDVMERLKREREARERGGGTAVASGVPSRNEPEREPQRRVPPPVPPEQPQSIPEQKAERRMEQQLSSTARAGDKHAAKEDRKRAQEAARANQRYTRVRRGFVGVDGARQSQWIAWVLFGFGGFINSFVTTVLGVAAIWEIAAKVAHAPIAAYIIGTLLAAMFIYGQLEFAPSIIDRVREKERMDLAEIFIYFMCVVPDTVFTGLFHWFAWVQPVAMAVFPTNRLVAVLSGLALCIFIAVVSAILPLFAVVDWTKGKGVPARG